MKIDRGAIGIKIIGVVFIILILVATGAFFYWNFSFRTVNYVIPNVSYGGIFNHTGIFKNISGANADEAVAMVSISSYWDKKAEPDKAARYAYDLMKQEKWRKGEDLVDFFQKNGNFNVQKETLRIKDLKKYVNSKTRTPLVFFYPVSIDESADINYYPAAILVGIKDSEKKVVLHNYWLGNNYEMSFSDFEKGWNLMKEEKRNQYIIIQPKNFSEKIKEIASGPESYNTRTAMMDKTQEIVKNMAFGIGLYKKSQYKEATPYFEKAKSDPDFEKFAPAYFKVVIYSYLANCYLLQSRTDEALESANLAMNLNNNLDKPNGDWVGYDTGNAKSEYSGILGLPYRVLGGIMMEKNELDGVKENFQKAIDIVPDDQQAISGLKYVEMKEKGQLENGTK